MAIVLGITGGIASGKTTVLGMLRELGAETASADVIAREVLEPGTPAFVEVVREFGQDIVSSDGWIDRKKLGEIVFSDPEKRESLNRITHPRIITRVEEIIKEFRQRKGQEKGAVLAIEIPLLYECGLQSIVDHVLVVAAEQESLLSRLMSRDKISKEAAEARLAAQKPLSEKIAMSDLVVWTDHGLENTREQVRRIYRQVGGQEQIDKLH